MPLFFFDISDAEGFHRDEIGEDLEGFEDARTLARMLLPQMLRDEPPAGEHVRVACEVRDGARTVYRAELTFRGRAAP